MKINQTEYKFLIEKNEMKWTCFVILKAWMIRMGKDKERKAWMKGWGKHRQFFQNWIEYGPQDSSTESQRSEELNCSVKIVLIYEGETWKMTKSMEQRLQVFVNKRLWSTLRIYRPTTQYQIRRCGKELTYKTIRRRKWIWIGFWNWRKL